MYSLIRFSFLSLVSVLFLQQCKLKLEDKVISVDEVYRIINDSIRVNEYVVLDTRARMPYVRGHLVSAFWLSPDSIENKMEVILNEKRPLIIYDSGEMRETSKVVRALIDNGATNFF